MPGKFFDTSVLVYMASDDIMKADRAEELVSKGGTISLQILNELANVARRKMRISWNETHLLLSSIRMLLIVHPLTIDIHDTGLALAEKHRFSIYDAMVVASALHADCDTLWSEDIQNGMLIEQRLRIVNPFLHQ